jgi:hypothetical protein
MKLWQAFRESIEKYGQLDPIIMRGDVIIDGRNRMKACVELDIEPVIETGTMRKKLQAGPEQGSAAVVGAGPRKAQNPEYGHSSQSL